MLEIIIVPDLNNLIVAYLIIQGLLYLVSSFENGMERFSEF